jgi:ribonuclease Z
LEAKLTILGSGSAAPSLQRANTAQILHIDSKKILIDCGEGTQLQMLKLKINAFKIDLIFISHLHGDHYLGLPGLLNTLSLYGRIKPLRIYGPKGLKKLLLLNFKEAHIQPNFDILITEIKSSKKKRIYKDNELSVYSFPLQHRIPCFGYYFLQNHFSLKINKEKCDQHQLGIKAIVNFKNKIDHHQDGKTFDYKQFTIPFRKKISYTFITDTLFIKDLAVFFKATNLLYHESTYLNSLLDKAYTNFHSTALQAAEMAKLCQAQHLIIGHFSSRYHSCEELLLEARSLFENCDLAEDGKVFVIK